MNLKSIINLVLCSSLMQFYLIANVPSIQFDIKDGLPNNKVFVINQSLDGVLWIGYSGGVCTFDGKEFKKIELPTLSDYEFIQLKKFNDHSFLSLNVSGQMCLLKNNKAELITVNRSKNYYIKDLIAIEDDIYFIANLPNGTSGIFKSKNKLSEKLNFDFELVHRDSKEHVNKAYLQKIKNNLIYKCSKVVMTFNHLNQTTNTYNLQKDIIGENIITYNDSYFHFSKDKILIRNENFTPIDSITIERPMVRYKVVDDKIFTLNNPTGTGYINLVNKKFINIELDYHYNNVFIDNKKRIWLATDENGIFLVPSLENLHLNDEKIKDNNLVSSIIQLPNKSIIAGTKNGLLLTITNEEIKTLKWKANHPITKIIQLPKNYFGVITKKSFHLFDQKIRLLNSITDISIKDFCFDNDTIFLCSNIGLHKIMIEDLLQKNINLINEKFLIQRKRYYSIKNDERNIFASNLDGIFKLEENEKITKVQTGDDIPNLKNIVKTQNGKFWILSTNKLINLQNLNEFYIIPELKNQNTCIINTIENEIFFQFENELICFNTQTKKSYNLISNLVCDFPISSISKFENKYWLTNKDGIFIIPNLIKVDSTVHISTKIEKYFVENKPVESLHNLKIPITENNISVEINMTNYLLKSKQSCFYKFGKINEEVNTDIKIRSTNEGILNFDNLESGEYQLLISSNSLYFDNENLTKINFTILKPFYQETWFYLIFALLIIGLSFIYSKYTIEKIRKRASLYNTLRNEVSDAKLALLQQQLSPHFISNLLSDLKNKFFEGDSNQAILLFEKVSDHLKNLFQYSANKTVYLDDEFNFIHSYLELINLRKGSNTQLKVETNSLELEEIEIPTMLLQPVIENSIKHGKPVGIEIPLIKISLKIDTDFLIIRISNNGPLLSENKNHLLKNKSLSIIEQRLMIWNETKNNIILSNDQETKSVVTFIKIKL